MATTDRGYTVRKASETGGMFKQFARTVGKGRKSIERECRMKCPYTIIPCVTCLCVTVKITILQMIEPVVIPIACIAGIISFFMRCFSCTHGKDLVYSCLEWCEIIDDSIGLYWEVDWWRKHEKREILEV